MPDNDDNSPPNESTEQPSTKKADESKNFTLLYQNAERRRINGWNELWGTPRESEYALETGSVFLFALKAQAGDDQTQQEERKEELLRQLWKLEEEGIGQRRAEGFGRVCISDPVHLEGTSHE
jgi:CRISPR-associated protein Csx10